jgi:hypothetical protein
MARYWVGGTAAWDATAGTKWATTSGGAGGAAVPTSADDVFFDAASGAVTVTVSTTTGICKSLTFTGFTGTLAGSTALQINGDLTVASGMTWTHAGTVNFQGTGGITSTITSNGKTIGPVTIARTGLTVVLADALTLSNALTVTEGTFTTNGYSITATSLVSNSGLTRVINLGSSTVTLSGSGSVMQFSTTTGLTFNAGTSTIFLSSAVSPNINVAATGLTFYGVVFSGANATAPQISGSNTFDNLTVIGRTSAGVKNLILTGNQTINTALTLSGGTNATMRTFVSSDVIGTTRTLTCASVDPMTDIDFRDITIAGAAAPVSGTRLGDCKGNSGITFGAGKTVYWVSLAPGNWSSTGWSNVNTVGTASNIYFPLAQDTAVFSTYPNSGSGITVNANYNIGTIDMSGRTSNTVTLATGTTTPAIYGNWINGTGTTLTGTATLIFAGRGSQTITSAGKTFPHLISINSPSGSVKLQDAFATSANSAGALSINSGNFDANGYNVSLTGSASTVDSSPSSMPARTIAIGSGTWVLAGSSTAWSVTATNLTVTGTGTISLTSASAKTFAGGGIQTYPTLNQGGTGALTITGSNGFRSMTNTAIGSVLFTGGTTNTFSVSFSLNGALANLLTLGSTNTTQAIVKKPTSWQMGLTSVDAGNNTGLTFLSSDGTMSYLSVSYINGQLSAVPYTGNFFAFF